MTKCRTEFLPIGNFVLIAKRYKLDDSTRWLTAESKIFTREEFSKISQVKFGKEKSETEESL
jgi:hypothetical protein